MTCLSTAALWNSQQPVTCQLLFSSSGRSPKVEAIFSCSSGNWQISLQLFLGGMSNESSKLCLSKKLYRCMKNEDCFYISYNCAYVLSTLKTCMTCTLIACVVHTPPHLGGILFWLNTVEGWSQGQRTHGAVLLGSGVSKTQRL